MFYKLCGISHMSQDWDSYLHAVYGIDHMSP